MPKDPKRKSTQYKPLTVMQEAYAQEYVKCPENQTQAAINAGFSPKSAHVKASTMMRDERIQKRIAELMEERNKRLRVSADYVLLRLVEIDQMDVLDILNDDMSIKPVSQWPKVWRQYLSGFDLADINQVIFMSCFSRGYCQPAPRYNLRCSSHIPKIQ